MFILYANKTQMSVKRREPITSGSVGAFHVCFEFSDDWDGMERMAVFKAGRESRSVLLDDSRQCAIPWEVLAKPNIQLQAGVYGAQGGEVVLPTVWANLGSILEGAVPGGDAHPPTPDLWEQELNRRGDTLGYTETGELGLYAGDRLLSAVPVRGGGNGTSWGVGHGLKVVGGDLTVAAVGDFAGDNTLPMTAAGVLTTVGNIEALLGTI